MRRRGLSDHIEDKSEKNEKALIFGQVTKVWDKETDEIEEGNIEVNIKTVSNDNEYRRIPLTFFDHSGHVSVPRVGDPIVIDFTSGKGNTPVAVASSHDDRDEHRAPNAREGHWRHEWPGENDNVYLEAEPSDSSGGVPDVVRMGIKPSGLEEATTEVAVDNSGSEPQIKIETDGDITLDADGDILINTSEGTGPVARQGHTHDYTWSDDGGSGTTDTPNEPGTETEIG